MDEPRQDEDMRADGTPEAVPALMEAQLETARARVFRAYLRSREKARELGAEGWPEADDRQRRAS